MRKVLVIPQGESNQEITGALLSNPEYGELAVVNLHLLRELINVHSHKVSYEEKLAACIRNLQGCANPDQFKAALQYELSMITLYTNLQQYDREKAEGDISKW